MSALWLWLAKSLIGMNGHIFHLAVFCRRCCLPECHWGLKELSDYHTVLGTYLAHLLYFRSLTFSEIAKKKTLLGEPIAMVPSTFFLF